MSKKIFIASDHAGLDYKNKVKEYLINNNFEVVDFGNSPSSRSPNSSAGEPGQHAAQANVYQAHRKYPR